MKINSIEVHILRKELSTSMQISRGGFRVRRHCIIQIITDDGTYGLGEGVGNPDAIRWLIEKCMAPMIIGLPTDNIEHIYNKLVYDSVYFERSGSWICAVSAIETALWDIKGKKEKRPVYELLGGIKHPKLELYASDVYWYEDTSLVQRDIESILEKDIKNIKIHTGVLPPKEEHQRFNKIKSCFNNIQKLMIDLNCAYDLEQGILAAKYFSDFGPYWLEEPLKIQYEKDLHLVKEQSKIPIAYGENIMNAEGFEYLYDRNAIDFAMPDVARIGGIGPAFRILELSKKYQITPSFHNFSSGVLLSATMHLIAAHSEPTLLEYDSSKNSVIHELFTEPLKIKNGFMEMIKKPGLGVELTKEALSFKE